MIQEMQNDQKPEEVQISFKVYVDHAKDGQNDTMSCTKGAPHLVLTVDLTELTTVGTPTCRRETRVISTREGK